MNTVTKGEIAQLKAELRAIEKGFIPSRTSFPCRYDLVIDDNEKLWRVQVKYGDGKTSKTPGSVQVALNYTDRNKEENPYTSSQVDAFLIYLPRVDSLVWIPGHLAWNKTKLQIRVEESEGYSNSIWYKTFLW